MVKGKPLTYLLLISLIVSLAYQRIYRKTVLCVEMGGHIAIEYQHDNSHSSEITNDSAISHSHAFSPKRVYKRTKRLSLDTPIDTQLMGGTSSQGNANHSVKKASSFFQPSIKMDHREPTQESYLHPVIPMMTLTSLSLKKVVLLN